AAGSDAADLPDLLGKPHRTIRTRRYVEGLALRRRDREVRDRALRRHSADLVVRLDKPEVAVGTPCDGIRAAAAGRKIEERDAAPRRDPTHLAIRVVREPNVAVGPGGEIRGTDPCRQRERRQLPSFRGSTDQRGCGNSDEYENEPETVVRTGDEARRERRKWRAGAGNSGDAGSHEGLAASGSAAGDPDVPIRG